MAARKAPAKTKATAPALPISAEPRHVVVGCCGFPVPPTRYFKDFSYVEVQEAHMSAPQMGTIRRWKREAAPEFTFAVMGPREIGQEGYREGKMLDAALATLDEVAKALGASTVVFAAPQDFAHSRPNKALVRDFLIRIRKRYELVVWEPPSSWDADEASSLAQECKAVAARDPLVHGIGQGSVGYYRMGGPAGHKSRYEDPAIEQLATLASGARHAHATYVFTNVDMFADARRFQKTLGV
jgi:uncharacterized protein YecE (DUF72 family)